MAHSKQRSFMDRCLGRNSQSTVTTPQIQVLNQNIKHQPIRQEIPNGFIVMHAGVQRANKTYTSPLLCIYTQRLSSQKSTALRSESTLGPRSPTTMSDLKEFTSDTSVLHTETDVIIVPVEDIIQISFKSDVKKDVKSDSRSEILEDKELTHNCCDSCADSICGGCCMNKNSVGPADTKKSMINNSRAANDEDVHDEPMDLPRESCSDECCDAIRCWCCRREKVVRRVRRTFKKREIAASRILTISITYSEFNNLDTPSNVRLLPENDRLQFFKDKFNPEKEITFHMVNTTDFESRHFDAKTKDAELLCRIVLHLKAVKPDYPSDAELDKMLDQIPRRIFGDAFSEAVVQPVRAKQVPSEPTRARPAPSEPVRSEPPRSEAPRSQPARSEPPRSETPRSETPHSETPKKPPVTTTSIQDQKQSVPIVERDD